MTTLEKKFILRPSWIWEQEVTDFVKNKMEGYSLNVCAGVSELGDVKVDLDPKRPKVQIADMKNLPFDTNTFDTVVSDPPWKIGFYDRFRQFFECVRVCKPNGKIILNAYWVPYASNAELLETMIKAKRTFTNVSIISVSRKTRTETEAELAGRHDPFQPTLEEAV